MPDIKTKNTGQKTIKTIDKLANTSEKMKDTFIRTNDKAEHGLYSNDNSPDEYATERVSDSTSNLVHEAAHQFDKQGRKGFNTTKQNILKAKEYVKNRRTNAKTEATNKSSSGNTFTKTNSLEHNNNIKNAARFNGKKAFKETGKETIKTVSKSIKT